MTEIDFNALGQAIDSTFGRASTGTTATQSVKFLLRDAEMLEARYTVIVNLVSDQELADLKKRYADEAASIVGEAIKRVRADYNETTGKTVKLKQVADTDSVEIIDLNIYNKKRTAYYRRNILFKIS